MSNIIVFDKEKELGLEEQILSQSSIAFNCGLVTDKVIEDRLKIRDFISIASDSNPEGLYQHFSILVSTGWNKNDDIFSPQGVWAARKTPIYKPSNMNHVETEIVGCIVNSWPITASYDLIPDDTSIDDLPDQYHILISSVIYNQWKDEKLKDRSQSLIASIEDGSMCVSMECIFKGFDYGIITPDGDNHIVARTEETCFLSRHLRAYGGTGTYDDHKVGRVLKAFDFKAKGYTTDPANPFSVTFNKSKMFSFANCVNDVESIFLNKNGVANIQNNNISDAAQTKENDIMAENKDSELLAKANQEIQELKDKLAKADIAKYEDEIKKLQDSVASLNDANKSLESDKAQAASRITELESTLEASKKELEEAKSAMDQMKEEEKKKDRKGKMCEAGMTSDEVEAKYAVFSRLSDEDFQSMIDTIAAFKPKDDKKKDEGKDDSKATADDAQDTSASVVVENTDDAQATHSLPSDTESETEVVRASLENWVSAYVCKKPKTKE